MTKRYSKRVLDLTFEIDNLLVIHQSICGCSNKNACDLIKKQLSDVGYKYFDNMFPTLNRNKIRPQLQKYLNQKVKNFVDNTLADLAKDDLRKKRES